jgi:hypothetical protein
MVFENEHYYMDKDRSIWADSIKEAKDKYDKIADEFLD